MTSRIFPILWLVCFAAAFMPFPAYEAHAVMLSYTVVAASLAFVILKAPLPARLEPLHLLFLLPVFLFWDVAFFSILFSEVQTVSFIWFCFFSLMPLTLCCALLASDRAQFFEIAGLGVAAIFAALSIWSLVQFFAAPNMLLFGRVHWPFADPNSLAGVLSLGFFCAFGVMIAAKNKLYANAGLVIAVLTMAAIFTTGSRGAVVAMVIGLVIFAATNRAHLKRHVKCAGILGIAAVVVFVALGYLGAEVAEPAGQRIGATFSGAVPVFWARPEIWMATWDIIKDHFWTGTGIGTFYLYYDAYRGVDLNSAGRMAHSDPLQFWAEMGVLAPVLFYVILGVAAFLTARALKLLPQGDVRRVTLMTPFCALTALVLHAHITFHFYVLTILMLAGLLLAYWFWQVQQISGTKVGNLPGLPLPGRSIQKVILIVPLLACSYVFLMLQAGQIYGAQAQTKMYAGDLEGFITALNDATRVSMRHDAGAMITGVNIPLGFLEHAPPDMDAAALMPSYAQGMSFLDEAGKLNPRLAAVPYFKARMIQAMRGRMKVKGDPETLMLEALQMNPLYYPARIDLAKLYQDRGDDKKAYDLLYEGAQWREAADVPPDYYLMLAEAAKQQGNMKQYEAAMKFVEQLRPRIVTP